MNKEKEKEKTKEGTRNERRIYFFLKDIPIGFIRSSSAWTDLRAAQEEMMASILLDSREAWKRGCVCSST